MKAFLSGMPTCRLGLNMHAEDCMFNSVVSQGEWDVSKSISFIPPDNGNKTEFEVMRYRLSEQIKPPFRVVPQVVETGRTRVNVRFPPTFLDAVAVLPVQANCFGSSP
jgi:hypothetical protein